MERVFLLVTDSNKETHEEASFKYAYFAKKHGWMDEVRVILWGSPERMVVEDEDLGGEIKRLLTVGVEVIACKVCSDNFNVSSKLEELGVKVIYVGELVTNMLKNGWYQLSF